MTDEPVNQRIATKAIIINDQNQVLILREAETYEEGTNYGRYGIPGGRLGKGEPFIEGLKREVLEESGLSVEVGSPVYVGEWFPVIKDVKNQVVAIFFRCKPITNKVSLSIDHDDYKWVGIESLKDYDIMSPEPEAIRLALNA